MQQLVEKVAAFEGMCPDATEYGRWRSSNTSRIIRNASGKFSTPDDTTQTYNRLTTDKNESINRSFSASLPKHRLTIDKNESINQSFSASLPKNVKFSRNAHGQVFSNRSRKLWSREFTAAQVGECMLSYYERWTGR